MLLRKKLEKPIRVTYMLEREDILTLEEYRKLYDLRSHSEALRDILSRIRREMGWRFSK